MKHKSIFYSLAGYLTRHRRGGHTTANAQAARAARGTLICQDSAHSADLRRAHGVLTVSLGSLPRGGDVSGPLFVDNATMLTLAREGCLLEDRAESAESAFGLAAAIIAGLQADLRAAHQRIGALKAELRRRACRLSLDDEKHVDQGSVQVAQVTTTGELIAVFDERHEPLDEDEPVAAVEVE